MQKFEIGRNFFEIGRKFSDSFCFWTIRFVFLGQHPTQAQGKLINDIRRTHSAHVIPSAETSWFTLSVGGLKTKIYPIHVSLTEYMAIIGSPMVTSGHAGDGWFESRFCLLFYLFRNKLPNAQNFLLVFTVNFFLGIIFCFRLSLDEPVVLRFDRRRPPMEGRAPIDPGGLRSRGTHPFRNVWRIRCGIGRRNLAIVLRPR